MITTEFECIFIKKLKKILEKEPSKIEKWFLPSEIAYCNKYKEKYIRFAGTLAAKLAFIKAYSHLRLPFIEKIEIKRNKNGKPFIAEDNKILRDYSISVSISHTQSVAVALCVISKNGKILSTTEKKR